jgi:acetyl-CoA decarbonylase/synthase complex subunit beta
MADVKLDISPMYEGERIRKDDLWVELGGPKADGFELSLATPMDQIVDGRVTVIGPDLKDIKEGSTIPFGMIFKFLPTGLLIVTRDNVQPEESA